MYVPSDAHLIYLKDFAMVEAQRDDGVKLICVRVTKYEVILWVVKFVVKEKEVDIPGFLTRFEDDNSRVLYATEELNEKALSFGFLHWRGIGFPKIVNKPIV